MAMVLDFAGKHLKAAATLTATYDLSSLGKRQRNVLLGGLRTGIVSGGWNSLPAQLVKSLTKAEQTEGAPLIAIERNYMYWRNIEDPEFFKLMDAMAVADKVTNPDVSWNDHNIESVKERRASGAFTYPNIKIVNLIRKKIALGTPTHLHKLADDIESGQVKELVVPFVKKNGYRSNDYWSMKG